MPADTWTIEFEASHIRPNRVLAMTVAMMVQRLARQSDSELEHLNHEWRLTPDDWLKIKFIASPALPNRVCISVGLPVTAIPPGTGLQIRAGRWPGWSRFWLRAAEELPAVENFLDAAFYLADSDYRKVYGKPVVVPGPAAVPPAVNAGALLPQSGDGADTPFYLSSKNYD